jgi:acyl dehydratase
MDELRFDDVEGLRKKIDEGFGPWSPPIQVTQEMIDRFADVTGDHQWIHVDIERAKRESPFGTTIAHGFLTLSLVPKLSAGGAWRVTGFGNATNYGADKLRFVSPVPAGSSVHARSRLLGVEAKPKGTQLTQEIHIHVVGSDRPALTYEMLTLYHPPLRKPS